MHLNSHHHTAPQAALNFELPQNGGPAPEWIQLLPAGSTIVGRDGRTWINETPAEIVAAFVADGKPMPLDWEHSTELKAPKGEPAPAAGWIAELELREDGSLWGRVEWTARGAVAVTSKEYRFISPVFIYDCATNLIMKLTSVGLTNRPNLHLQALNRQHHEEEAPMLKKLLQALGLSETATEEAALNQITKLQGDLATALNRAEQPSLDKFVPKADYDAVVAKAANTEQTLKTVQDHLAETAVNAEIDAALKAGKITPATVEYHKAQCRQEGGLDRFKAFCQAAPTVAGDTGLGDKKPGDAEAAALNAEEARVAAMFGNSAEDITKYGKGA